MKKYLLFLMALVLTLPAMALGNGSGNTKANAIEFDWEKGNIQEPSENAKWYRITLDTIYKMEEPSLAIYLTNLSKTDAAQIHVKGSLAGQTEERDYTLAAGKNQIWSQNAGMLIQMQATEVFITVKTSQQIAISAKAYETVDIDEMCLQAVAVTLDGAPVASKADEQWYKLNWKAVQADPTREIQLVVKNQGAATSLTIGVSPDCPSTGLTTEMYDLAAGGQITHMLSRAMIGMLPIEEIYIKTIASSSITLEAKTVSAPTINIFDGTAQEVKIEETFTAQPNTLYKIKVADLRRSRYMPEFSFTNPSAGEVAGAWEYAFDCPTSSVFACPFVLPNGETGVETIENNMIATTDKEYLYFRFTASTSLTVYIRLKHVREGDACRTSVDYELGKEMTQGGGDTIWYAVDIAQAKREYKNLEVSVTNIEETTATVTAFVAFSCPYIDLQTFTRNIAGRTTLTKTLQWSLFGAMASDTVYIGVATNKSLEFKGDIGAVATKPADDACLNAIPFNWKDGHVQAAGEEAVWYKVSMADVDKEKLPTITITNRGTAPVHIQGEMSLECPDDIENAARTLTIQPNGIYTKTLTRDLINSISSDVEEVYFRIVTDQEIAFSVAMIEPEAGSSCDSPIRFNWVSGNDHPAGEELWYLVDLSEAKTTNKDINIRVSNRSHNTAQVEAAIAFECPCDVPQVQRATFGDMQTRATKILHSTLSTFDDIVYIRVHSTELIHVEAELVEPAPFEPIDCPDDIVDFEWGKQYTTTAEETWYKVDKTDLEALLTTELTPHATVYSAEAMTITASMAYDCPVTEAMQSKSKYFAAGQTMTKLVERSLAEQLIAKHEQIIVRIEGKGVSFHVDLVDPNTGADCLHAIDYTIGTEEIQQPNTTVWYRLDRKALVNADRLITLGIANTNNQAAPIHAAVYMDCESDVWEERSFTIGANGTLSREVPSDLFAGFATDYFYLCLTTAANQEIKLFSTTREYPPIEPITACEDAIDALVNTDYELAAGAEQWYVINIRDLQVNTVGDGVLTVRNLDQELASARAEISWDCPVMHEMVGTTRTINPTGEVQYKMQRAQIMAFEKDKVYVRITTDRRISFRFDIKRDKGDECANPILFDWDNGNIHPGGYLWYLVEMTEDRIPADKDLRLHIVNLSKTEPAEMEARIYTECEDLWHTLNHTLEAGESIYQDIDRDLIAQMGWTNWQIYFSSDQQTKIYAEIVDAMPPCLNEIKDTIAVCDGSTYEETIPLGDKEIVIKQEVYYDDPITWEYYDEGTYRSGAQLCQYTISYTFRPLIPIPATDKGIIEEIEATPLLVEGMTIFPDTSIVRLKEYYAAQPNWARVKTIYWSEDAAGKTPVDVDMVLPKGTERKTLYLHIEDSCDNRATNFQYEFLVESWRVDTKEIDIVGCVGETIQIRQGDYVITQDEVLTQTVENVEITEGPAYFGRTRLIDSVYTYTIHVRKEPDSLYRMPVVENIVAREWLCGAYLPISHLNNVGKILLADFADGYPAEKYYATVEHIVWERKHTDNTYTAITEDVLCRSDEPLVIRYGATTDCGETLYTDDFVVEVTPSYTEDPDVQKEYICFGEEVTFGGKTYTEPGTYYDTVPDPTSGCHLVRTLELSLRPFYIPFIEDTMLAPICGLPIDTTATADYLRQEMAADPLFATDVAMAFLIEKDGQWKSVKDNALDGQMTKVQIKVVLSSTCVESTIDTTFYRSVATATADSDPSLAKLPAKAMYGNRLLMLDMVKIQALFPDWTIAEEDVVWYEMVGATPNNEVDQAVGTGFYYTLDDAEAVSGTYYAEITHEAANAADCSSIARTVLLQCVVDNQSPALHPSIVQPGEDITVLHLNPMTETTIIVYSSTGQKVATYTSREAEQFLMKAADNSGYYMVDIHAEGNRVTLRYVVK